MKSLQILEQNRDVLLLAEVIGWLHDYRKCSDEHLKAQADDPEEQQGLQRSNLANFRPRLNRHHRQGRDRRCERSNLANFRSRLERAKRRLSTPPADLLDGNTWNKDLLDQFLSHCHNTAHFDKQEPIGGKQNYHGVQISSPFGFERNVVNDLTTRLCELCESITPFQRTKLQTSIRDLFSQTVADTRRPINEVDLWSWGLLVGALYKAALASALLAGSAPAACDLRWRLLGIRVNGLDYLLGVVRIPDLLARQELLNDSLNKVRELLEVTYPLGSEVYRDENGSLFVVPDIPDLLKITDNSGATLRDLILQAFAQGTVRNSPNLQLGGEMVPYIWGQDPNWLHSQNDKLPDVGALLTQKVISTADTTQIRSCWQNNMVTDICTVCGLRPQGPSQKAADRNVCDICEVRRADRSKEWATSRTDCTIWTDEVADVNGRLALIVGQFDLTHWLDGSLLESLLLIAPDDKKNTRGKPVTSKTPSFSRLRRIWETTRTFWREVQDEFSQRLSDDRRRLKIYLKPTPNLAPYHVYDLLVGSTDLSVVWVPSQDSHNGYLLSADNLGCVARQLGAETGVYTHPATGAIFVEDYLKNQFIINRNCQPVLHNPDTSAGKGRANLIDKTRIIKVEYQDNRYATLIPILAEPRTFMILVPADRSLEVVKHIKEKYERELGKVRDRLPLFLGCIYVGRYTPIRAVLDAGRAMLAHRSSHTLWCVTEVIKQDNPTASDRHFCRYADIKLESDRNTLNWKVPLKMGDGTTGDLWYPYFFLETGGDDSKADASNCKAVRVSGPGSNGKLPSDWIVHAANLQPGETIYLWPSHFDFEFLDTTARRFEIHYDANGRRPRRTRPFYLEDLDRLETLWSHMKRLTKTQRHQVIRTIEATREAWYGQDPDGKSTTDEDEVFRQFVADTLAGAAWPQDHSWHSIPQEWRDRLINAGVKGELTDLAELHMEILKE